MKEDLLALTDKSSTKIANYFYSLSKNKRIQANEIIQKDEKLSNLFSSKVQELTTNFESQYTADYLKENLYLLEMSFFKQYLKPNHYSIFIGVSLITSDYKILKWLSQLPEYKLYCPLIKNELFYKEIKRIFDSNDTVTDKYLQWYENLIFHLPEEEKLKCRIGLLAVSISQYYTANNQKISKELGLEQKTPMLNKLSIPKRLNIINFLKEKVNFNCWPEEIKRDFNSNFPSSLEMHLLGKDIDRWLINLKSIAVYNKLDNGLESKNLIENKNKI